MDVAFKSKRNYIKIKKLKKEVKNMDKNKDIVEQKIQEIKNIKKQIAKEFYNNIQQYAYVPNLSLTGKEIVDLEDIQSVLKDMTK